jgi:hypothetical protein
VEWLDQFCGIVARSEPLDDRLPVCASRGRCLDGNAEESRGVCLIKVDSDDECDDSLGSPGLVNGVDAVESSDFVVNAPL